MEPDSWRSLPGLNSCLHKHPCWLHSLLFFPVKCNVCSIEFHAYRLIKMLSFAQHLCSLLTHWLCIFLCWTYASARIFCRLVWYHAENKVCECQGQLWGKSPDSLVDGSVLRPHTVTVIWAPKVGSAVSLRSQCHTLVSNLWSLEAMPL